MLPVANYLAMVLVQFRLNSANVLLMAVSGAAGACILWVIERTSNTNNVRALEEKLGGKSFASEADTVQWCKTELPAWAAERDMHMGEIKVGSPEIQWGAGLGWSAA